MANRTIAFWESAPDLDDLRKSGFNLHVAKSVTGPTGELTYNLVWQSKVLAPRTSISWTPIYGLNWTSDLPAAGVKVTSGGVWQQVTQGEAYDLTSTGEWVRSTEPGSAGKLTVGKNNYSIPGVPGIHILVGIQDTTGGFDPIYVDPVNLGLLMSANYEPVEKEKCWYQAGAMTGTMISEDLTSIQPIDTSAPNPATNQYYWSATFSYAAGIWTVSPNPPPSVALTGVMGSTRSSKKVNGADGPTAPPSLIHVVKFMNALNGLARTALIAYFIKDASDRNMKVTSAKFDVPGVSLTIETADAKPPNGFVGYSADPDDLIINNVLKDAQKAGLIDATNVWNIVQ